jgi:hypothetical protein
MGDGPLEVIPEEGEAGVGEERRVLLARLDEVAKLAELGGIHGLGSLPFPSLGFSFLAF